MEFGEIKALEMVRKQKKLSKEEFAVKELGVPYRTFQRWVARDTKPSNSNEEKIDKYLKDHKDLVESAKAEVAVEASFSGKTVLIQKPVWPTLPKETWKKLEDKGHKELMDKIEDFLKELAEREEIEA